MAASPGAIADRTTAQATASRHGRTAARHATSLRSPPGRFARFLGHDLVGEYPTGSGHKTTRDALAHSLPRRLIPLFLEDDDGRRPVFGDTDLFQCDSGWHDLVPFHEYFDGNTGRGPDASHQPGWTGLVAELIMAGEDEA